MTEPERGPLASASISRHLTRGAIGFALIGSALALTPDVGPAALLLAPAGMVALRGCPTCWIAGLVQTIAAGRLQRTCTQTGCTLHPRRTANELDRAEQTVERSRASAGALS